MTAFDRSDAAPSTMSDTSTQVQRPAWKVWLGRLFVGGLLAMAALTIWPMLKGGYYAMVPPDPVPADQLPAWEASFESALAVSAETGKPVLVDFTAGWCPPCKVMEADVWPNQDVRDAIAERVIPVQLDVDEPSSAAASRRYGVQYIPTILLVDAEGEVLARDSFMSAGAMVSFIEDNAPTPPATQPAPSE